jgi:hypothetical protein
MRYTIIIQSRPGDPIPETIRLRRLLKCMLRTFNFKAIQVSPHRGDSPVPDLLLDPGCGHDARDAGEPGAGDRSPNFTRTRGNRNG